MAVLSLKGSVGKTTPALYLGDVASAQGGRITVVDLGSGRSAYHWARHVSLP
ncbi:hypothetical protein [Deinococcus radiopugnans]|nr:hypothetical protein [Deinococcus radiopugnans]MBB6016914.1 cellulose biosynthesis protein BcsQ [Deinococcus radiopugnans ATCC 19172]